MKSIYAFEKSVHPFSDVMGQTVSVNPLNKKWTDLFVDYPILKETLDGLDNDGKGHCVISREMIFREKDCRRKAILTLLWGFPRGYRNSKTHKNAVKSVVEIAEENNDKNLTPEMFKFMIGKAGVGLSTLSKILYFFEYKVNGNPALILDSIVRKNIKEFSEFEETVKKRAGSYGEYVSYVDSVAEVSKNMRDVTPDQIEFFLFKFNEPKK